MESMAISEFKATCLAVLERVRRTKRPVLITRFGRPVAEVVPSKIGSEIDELYGRMEVNTPTVAGCAREGRPCQREA